MLANTGQCLLVYAIAIHTVIELGPYTPSKPIETPQEYPPKDNVHAGQQKNQEARPNLKSVGSLSE